MTRRIVVAPDFTGEPLTELKQWLAITNAQEDALLLRLLAAAHESCERFTGLIALAGMFEQQASIRCDWTPLDSRPVTAVAAVERLAIDGTRTPVDPADYQLDIDGTGAAQLRLATPATDKRMVVRFEAGLAQAWSALPPGLGEGILRLAAHAYRGRDREGEPVPPAAVAALWRPYRGLSL